MTNALAVDQPLTITETDEAVLSACTSGDGAVEDCEESRTEGRYFFESAAMGVVSRITGAVTIKHQQT
jgi:hypothetical protein